MHVSRPTHALESAARRQRWWPRLALAVASTLPIALAGLSAPSAAASDSTTGDRPTAAVSLGDSFISGEGGRWQGNAVPSNLLGDRWGTDRAAYDCWGDGAWCYHDPHRVYGNSHDNGCHRSDTAEINSADLPVDRRINLACSGATTDNIFRSANGGKSFKGEAPQADQLAEVAREHQVKTVVLSIGGNDLGFSDILGTCVKEYLKPFKNAAEPIANDRETVGGTPCRTSQDPLFKQRLNQTAPKVTKAVDEVRQTMANAGYSDGSYRIVLQSYPSVIAKGKDIRYPETYARFTQGGCPMFNADADWANDTVAPGIASMLEQVASRAKVQYLDLSKAFKGHELCSKGVHQATSANSLDNPLPSAKAEWSRFLVALGTQGDQPESMHPNAYGQHALGRCLTLATQQKPEGRYRC